MSSYMKNAKYVYDVHNQVDNVIITHTTWVPGTGWKDHTAYLTTKPEGDWNEIKFDSGTFTTYEDFMNTMVEKNLEVHRRIAKAALDTAIYEDKNMIKLMNCIKILDPTFVPPIINQKCGWQNELVEEIATITSARIIATCKNESRLDRYFRVLRVI